MLRHAIVRHHRAICALVGLILLPPMRLLAQEETATTNHATAPVPYHVSLSHVKTDEQTGEKIPLCDSPFPVPAVPAQKCAHATGSLPEPPAGAKLNFDSDLQCLEEVQLYYAGGHGGLGAGPGPNYGAEFSCNALIASVPPATCPAANEQGFIVNAANAPSAPNVVTWLHGPKYDMNVPAGFKDSVSVDYSAPFFPGSVEVFDGPDGTGKLLASKDLDTNKACAFPHQYCTWTPVKVSFTGTAKSVVFGGTPDFIAYDNITLGSDERQE